MTESSSGEAVREIEGTETNLSTEMIDREVLISALRECDVAKTRLVELTTRFTSLNEKCLALQVENSELRVKGDEALKREYEDILEHLVFERDEARRETDAVRSSRSYRLGAKLLRFVRRFVP